MGSFRIIKITGLPPGRVEAICAAARPELLRRVSAKAELRLPPGAQPKRPHLRLIRGGRA
jgi:hypothetical protein